MTPGFDLSAWQAENEREPPLTACNRCQHYKSVGTMNWDQLCMASPRVSFDARKGKYSQDGWHSIYEINKSGDCREYLEKVKESE